MSVLAFPKPRDIRFIQHGPDMPSLKPFQDCTVGKEGKRWVAGNPATRRHQPSRWNVHSSNTEYVSRENEYMETSGSPGSLCPCLAFYTPFNTEEEELAGCFTYILTLTPKTHFKVQRKFHSFLFLQPPIRVSSAAATLTCETDRRWTCDAIKSDLANI